MKQRKLAKELPTAAKKRLVKNQVGDESADDSEDENPEPVQIPDGAREPGTAPTIEEVNDLESWLDPGKLEAMREADALHAEIRDSGEESDPGKHPEIICKEIPHYLNGTRVELRDIVHRRICPNGDHYQDYHESFVEMPMKCRKVFGAFHGGKVVGGLSYYDVKSGGHIEFAGTKKDSHAGEPLIRYMQQRAKEKGLKFISLNSVDYDMETLNFWDHRGFHELDTPLMLRRLAKALKLKKELTKEEFFENYGVASPPARTVAMIWLCNQ